MKKLVLLGALVGGLSMSGLTSTAKADHCSVRSIRGGSGLVGRRGISYGSVFSPFSSYYSYARPSYYPRTYRGYGSLRHQVARGYSFYSPRFSISIGSGLYGRNSLGGHHHHHHHH